jgi:uncharacterized protein with GYD domain
MELRSLVIASAMALALAAPAVAQQSGTSASAGPHRYLGLFKYSDTAMKAMTENPQDRTQQAQNMAMSVGGKMETIYWLPGGGDYDGFVVFQLPDDTAAAAIDMRLRASGSFSKNVLVPVMDGPQYRSALEKVKTSQTNWTPPTASTSAPTSGSTTPNK